MRLPRFPLSLLWIVAPILLLAAERSAPTGEEYEKESHPVPILVYHRFAPFVADSMTVTTSVLESHLQYLQAHAYTVIPLQQFVAYCLGTASPPPPRAVVITVDDGHRSVYTHLLPLVKQYRVPVTLFIYPSAISNASYAMTWEQLRALQGTGLFSVQSHSYWHPNFKREKQRLSPEQYDKLVRQQLLLAKATLEYQLGSHVDMLAWPFGIYDDELMAKAVKAGYKAAFTLERRHASAADRIMALPRYLMTDAVRGQAFARLLAGRSL